MLLRKVFLFYCIMNTLFYFILLSIYTKQYISSIYFWKLIIGYCYCSNGVCWLPCCVSSVCFTSLLQLFRKRTRYDVILYITVVLPKIGVRHWGHGEIVSEGWARWNTVWSLLLFWTILLPVLVYSILRHHSIRSRENAQKIRLQHSIITSPELTWG